MILKGKKGDLNHASGDQSRKTAKIKENPRN